MTDTALVAKLRTLVMGSPSSIPSKERDDIIIQFLSEVEEVISPCLLENLEDRLLTYNLETWSKWCLSGTSRETRIANIREAVSFSIFPPIPSKPAYSFSQKVVPLR